MFIPWRGFFYAEKLCLAAADFLVQFPLPNKQEFSLKTFLNELFGYVFPHFHHQPNFLQ